MVDKLGTWNAADWISSNPRTDTSAGTRSPASWRARMLPIAEASLKQRIAVKGFAVWRSLRMPG